jgi:riboflavin synthase
MFTGIIEELGRIHSLESLEQGMRLVVCCELVASDTKNGDSIAVNGACLTALNVTPGSFAADVSPETLARTTLGQLAVGSPVNLERALTPSTRLGGHIVQGHVDARGKFLAAEDHGDFRTVRIGFPADIARYIVHKGSIAVEGISLTVASLAADSFDIAVIPKTWDVTNLSSLKPGDPVNLEVDVIAKYVERMMSNDRLGSGYFLEKEKF